MVFAADAPKQIISLEDKVNFLEIRAELIADELVEKFGIYVVQPNDTISQVARKIATTVEKLLEWNP